MVTAKRLGLAGLVLAEVLTVLSPRVYAKNVEGVKIESESTSPQIIATFESESHRPEPEYKGKVFRYYLWSDGRISQANSSLRPDSVVEPETRFASRWFYDIDGDGEFGKAELDWIKSGRLVYMHPEFNKIANAEIRKAFGSVEQKTEPPSAQEYELPLKQLPEEKKKAKQIPVSLISGLNTNFFFNAFSGSTGIRLNFPGKKDIGLAALLDMSSALDKETSSLSLDYYDPVYGSNINLSGTEKMINARALGFSGEIQYGSLIIGGGADYWNSVREVREEIRAGENALDVLNSNVLSVPEKKVSKKFYAGFEIPVGKRKNWKIGGICGYDTERGVYFGIRNALRLNPPKE